MTSSLTLYRSRLASYYQQNCMEVTTVVLRSKKTLENSTKFYIAYQHDSHDNDELVSIDISQITFFVELERSSCTFPFQLVQRLRASWKMRYFGMNCRTIIK